MRAALVIAPLLWGCATGPAVPRAAEADRLLRAAALRTGNLRIDCSPDDAVVAVDGVSVGLCSDFRGDKGLALKEGPRRIAVSKLGYLPYESFVDTDGTRVSVKISLAPSSLEGKAR